MTPEQLGNLVDAHAAALTLYARQWCATPEDIVQEAFVKLMSQRTEPDRVLPWLYRVVRNGALDAARAERRRRKYEGEAAARAPVWFAPNDEARIDGETATVALQELAAEQREIVVARLWGGLTFEQIAEVTGTSSSAAHRAYHAGLRALRERLRVPCLERPTIPN